MLGDFERVEFSGQQTYDKVKKVFVEAHFFNGGSRRVLEIRRYPGESGWVLYLPESTDYSRVRWSTLPARALTALAAAKTLRDCKTIAARVVLAAGNAARLEELRTAKEIPEWARKPAVGQ